VLGFSKARASIKITSFPEYMQRKTGDVRVIKKEQERKKQQLFDPGGLETTVPIVHLLLYQASHSHYYNNNIIIIIPFPKQKNPSFFSYYHTHIFLKKF